ncbi:MAG: methyltransferase domain-containing protein [Solirubrobacteraceae bacterium]|nr:methyltransferase domain-containing protein [Solirubrobacteraceae bacterium]
MERPTLSPGYGTDVAHVHDAGFGEFARSAAPGLLRRLRAVGAREGVVVDLGCGSGIWAAELIAHGYDVVGIDQSAPLLAIARERAAAAELRQESIYDAELPACVAVTALGEILSYKFDDRAGRAAARGLLRRVHDAIRPGGLFLFDVVAPGRAAATGSRGFAEGDDWLITYEAEEDGERLTRRITTFRLQDDGSWRRDDETHRLWTWTPPDVVADLADAGFTETQVLRGYGPGHRFPRGWAGFSARRPV